MARRSVLDGWLLAVCLARALLTLIFMTYAACLPVLRVEWGMSARAAGSIATGFQVGYAVSLLVLSAVADRVGARRVFLGSAAASAVTALGFAVFARSWLSALVLYSLAALAQGGTYTTAIMLVSDRYAPAGRGAAVGWLIASSSLGYALSLGLSGLMLPVGGYRLAFLATALGPLAGTVVSWLVLRGMPNTVHPRPAGPRLRTELVRNRNAVSLILGYTCHSWELLGMWAWTPAFLAASFTATGRTATRAVELGAYLSGAFHLVGIVASSSMGRLSDRLGRRPVLIGLAGTSAACSLVFGWLVNWPVAVLAAIGALYAFTALGDSPVLSTGLTEAVTPGYLGSALAVRSLMGFGAGAVAPWAFGAILDATNPPGAMPVRWGWAFVALGVGGLGATASACGVSRSLGRPAGP